VNSDGHLYEGKMHSSDDTGMFSPIVLIFNHYLPFGRDFSVLKFSTVKSGKKMLALWTSSAMRDILGLNCVLLRNFLLVI
jgi:hypothetical protein